MWFPPAATLVTGFPGGPMPVGTVHWLYSLYPQQATEPSASSATVWETPAATLATGF